MPASRNPAIDVLKGVLMVLVMLGHLSGAGVDYSWFKWSLYGFHMPMFMALSGYMMNVERLRAQGLGALWQRYWGRMILPWLVVFVIALPFYFNWRSPMGIAQAFLHPWNHLWFIPVLFVFIVAAVAIPLSRGWLLLISLLGAPLWFAPQLFASGYNVTPFDIRYIIDAPFFFFGLWLRTSGLKVGWWIAPVFLISLAIWSLTFQAPHSYLLAIYPVMTFGAIMLIPWVLRLPLRSVVLEVIGADSLFFYLHHPWVFNIARRTLYHWMNLNIAYAVTLAVTIAILLAARRVLRRNPWTALLSGVVPAGEPDDLKRAAP